MKKYILGLLLGVMILAPAIAQADAYPYLMRSTRALGMGDAFGTLSNDQFAPFYNVAGLSRANTWRFDLLRVNAEIGQNVLDMSEDMQDVDWDNESEVADFLRKNIGKPAGFAVSVYPSFYKRNFSLGVFGSASGVITPRNSQYPMIETDIVTNSGIALGVAHEFLAEDQLAVGVALKSVNRSSLQETYTVADITEDLDTQIEDDLKDGSGFLVDIGTLYTFKNVMLEPKAAFYVKNLGSSDFGDARDLGTTYNLSFGISPKLGSLSTEVVFDLRDITKEYDEDEDWGKRMHLGAEIFFKKFFALRGGFNQGYPSFGAGVSFWLVEIDYAYYSEEIGAYAGQDRDKRHAIELTVGF